MSAQDRAIQKLARELASIKREVVSWRGPQADYTSIENGGNFTFKDGDGNVTAVVGGQDDGSNTIRHVDGPTPPIPSGLSAHVDGPIVQVSWDGTFETSITHDWHYLEVLAVGPNNEQLTGTINDLSGGETSLAATAQGDWVVVARSVSRAGKRSLDGDAGTVAVQLVGLTGAIEAVQASADGKNTIYYSATMPPGADYVDGDLWFDTSEAGGNRASVWDGSQWLSVADARVADLAVAQADIDAAMVVLDGRLDAADTDITSLQDSLADLDSTTLPALRNDLDAAEGRLDSAEGQITDAFGQLDAVPGQISDAKQAAIDAAALDATDKSNAAQLAAEAKAATAQQVADLANDTAQALMSAGPNIIVNGDFENTSPSIWPLTTYQPGISVVTASHARSGTRVMRVDSSAGNRYPLTDWRDSAAGRIYYAEVWVYHDDTDMSQRGRVSFYSRAELKDGSAPGDYGKDLDGNRVHVYQDEMNPGEWNKVAAYITTPADTLRVRVAPHVLRNETPYDLDDFKVIDVTESIGALREARAAQDSADMAHDLAGNAQDAADAAMSAANGLSKVLHGTTVPTGTAPDGSIWWQHKGNLSGPVIGQWNRVGGSWKSTPIDSEAIANLDVGKLTAGTAVIAEAVVQKIAAQTASIQTADIKNLFVTGTASLSDVVAERIGAETAEFINLEVANLVASGAVIDEAVINQLFSDVVVAKMVTASEFIGENAILTGAVTADKMAVGSITAESGIIESLDLGTATVGELDGIRIMGQTVRGQQLSGDAIDGKVITGGTYRTTGGTGSWSDDGLFIAQPDGTSMVRFPTDGSPLSLTASDTQIERASVGDLDMVDGAVRSGGVFSLSAGVTPPASPPELGSSWKGVATLPRPAGRVDVNGFATWGSKWVRGVNVLGTGEGDRIEVYAADGELESSHPIGVDPQHGLAVIGDVCYVFGKDHDRPGNEIYCFGYNLNTGSRVTRWRFETSAPGNKIGVGVSPGGNLVTAFVPISNLYIVEWNPSTGAKVGADFSTPWDLSYTQNVQGVAWVGSSIYVSHADATRVYTTSGSTITRKTDSANSTGWAGWFHQNSDGAGLVWDGVPIVATAAGELQQGSGFASDTSMQACFTWFDGANETTPSPVASTVVGARETLMVSMPKRAGLQKRLYMRQGTSGDWVRETVGHDATAHTVTWVSPLVPRHTLPTTNTFPNADPATLKSTNDKFVVHGDGSGSWGPLTFNADGTMTSTAIPEWVPITSFFTGYSPQTWSFVPAYRLWPDGKVEWRGVVAGSVPSSGSTELFTIPVEARPAKPVDAVTATNGGAWGMTRIEFGSTTNPDKLWVFPPTSGITWVSLDNCYYYKN